MFEFTSNFTYFHRGINIWCMRSYLVYQGLLHFHKMLQKTISLPHPHSKSSQRAELLGNGALSSISGFQYMLKICYHARRSRHIRSNTSHYLSPFTHIDICKFLQAVYKSSPFWHPAHAKQDRTETENTILPIFTT